MSRQNKVNPGQYTGAGRLSPDDLGRQRRAQAGTRISTRTSKADRPMWEKTAAHSPSTTPPASRGASGGAKVAAAKAVVSVTRATAGAVKSVTRAARHAIGVQPTTKRASAPRAPRASSAAPAGSRTGVAGRKAPAGPPRAGTTRPKR